MYRCLATFGWMMSNPSISRMALGTLVKVPPCDREGRGGREGGFGVSALHLVRLFQCGRFVQSATNDLLSHGDLAEF